MKLRILLLLGLAFLIAFTGCNNENESLESQIAIPVSVQQLVKKPIEQFITTTGTANALYEAELTSESEGYYRLANNAAKGRPFRMGDFVKKGEVIIYLDNPEVENSVGIESQKLNLEISKQEYEKQKPLYEKGGVTLLELRTAERSYMDAEYAYNNALISLARLTIKAPFDGIIVSLPYFTPGVKVSSGQTMAKLMNYEELTMEINLPGQELGQVEVGQKVRAMNYTVPDDTLSGIVAQVSPALDADTRSFSAYINIENPDLILRPGMFVKTDIVTDRQDTAIVIPKDIIITRGSSKRVFIVEKGAARERRIKIGLENPEEVQVVEGLNKDERVVIKGFETLRNSSKVKVIQ